MGRIMQALPSFLTPPKSSKQNGGFETDDEGAPVVLRKDVPPSMSNRERRRAQNGGHAVGPLLVSRRDSKVPPNAFVMPYERDRPSSSSISADGRSKSPPPGYNPRTDAMNRRQTWGAPGTRDGDPGAAEAQQQQQQPTMQSLEDYKTSLKEWKKHNNIFMSNFQEVYLPGPERLFSRIAPQLESALQPLCGPQELQICIRHWEQETKRFASAGLACANAIKGLVRNAWNEVVVLDDRGTDGQLLMNKLRMDMDNEYHMYLMALEASKENLWHTLDFNIEGNNDLKYEVRASFWDLFDKFQIMKEEHPCGLFVLVTPDLESNGYRRPDTAPAQAPAQARHR